MLEWNPFEASELSPHRSYSFAHMEILFSGYSSLSSWRAAKKYNTLGCGVDGSFKERLNLSWLTPLLYYDYL